MIFWTHAKMAAWLLAAFLLIVGRYLAAALIIVFLIVPAKKAKS